MRRREEKRTVGTDTDGEGKEMYSKGIKKSKWLGEMHVGNEID